MADLRKALILRQFNIGAADGLSARPAKVGEIDDVQAGAYEALKREGLIADPPAPASLTAVSDGYRLGSIPSTDKPSTVMRKPTRKG